MNSCLYLDSRWNSCFTLTIDDDSLWRWRIRDNDLFCSFPVKGNCEEVFLLSCRLFFTNCNFTKDGTSFAGFFFFLNFDKKCRPITFRWLLLLIAFTQVVFRESFIEIASFNYSFTETWDQSNKIHFAASWWALIVKGRCNTLCSNDISLNVTLISTVCHLIVSS